MEHSLILLNFFVVLSLAFIVSANDGGYKILSYDEDYPGYPWQRINHGEWDPRTQRREDHPDLPNRRYSTNEMEKGEDGGYRNPGKSTSTLKAEMAERNFGRGSEVKFIYGRVPVPVIVVPSNYIPQH